MLIVNYYNANGFHLDKNESYSLIFYMGSGFIRQTVNENFMPDSNLIVQADGHELEVIRKQFINIQMASNRVVRWTGENARFIVENIRL